MTPPRSPPSPSRGASADALSPSPSLILCPSPSLSPSLSLSLSLSSSLGLTPTFTLQVSSAPKSRSRGNGGWGIASPRGGGRSSPRGIPTGWEEERVPRHAEPDRSPEKRAASGARFATDDALARSGLARPGYAPQA